MIFGLSAALGWGLADFGAAVVARRIGSMATVLLAQLAGLVAIAVMFVVARPSWTGTALDLELLIANGAIAAGAYLLLYRALELGPVALVSPIVAAYAVVTIPLAVLLLHESPSGLALTGASVTVVGVILTATDPRQAAGGKRMSRAGVHGAFAALLLFGVGTFILGRSSQHVGWLFTVALSRASTAVFLAAASVLRRPRLGRADAPGVAGALGVGLLDVVGVAMYSRGSQLGLVSIVTAASASFPLLSVLGGVVLLHERPAPTQFLGVALVIVGLLVLGGA